LTVAAAIGPTRAVCPVLGVDCFVGELEGAAETVLAQVGSGQGGYACLANAHVLVAAQHDEQLRAALDGAWIRLPDGAPVAWLQRRLGSVGASRVAGPDLMPLVIEMGLTSGLRHFLLGSTENVLELLHRHLLRRFPGARVAGLHSPSRPQIESDAPVVVEQVLAAKADVVWCAFGAPRQEVWMARHAAELAPAVLVGVGAAFDFIAGTKPRAPVWMQRRGLEWLHRLRTEPVRLCGRYLRTNSEFALRAVIELSRRA
jgi:N-acetylglucosaminyldiphosphoundecaprenol N-acetyl-beta-D-mannosaminyltransferase